MIIVAKHDFIVNNGSSVLHIVQGDKFTLHGKVFAYRSTIVDITKYSNLFTYVNEPESASNVQLYEFTKGMSISNGSNTVVFKEGDRFRSTSDIVLIHGVAVDLAKYAHVLKAVTEVEPDETPVNEVKSEETVVEPAPEVKSDEPVVEPAPEVKSEEPVVEPTPEVKSEETPENNASGQNIFSKVANKLGL
jgi:hypothetical protein